MIGGIKNKGQFPCVSDKIVNSCKETSPFCKISHVGNVHVQDCPYTDFINSKQIFANLFSFIFPLLGLNEVFEQDL